MKKYFPKYEIAKRLKDIGFNDICLAWYDNNKNFFYIEDGHPENNNFILDLSDSTAINAIELEENSKLSCSAPTYEQVVCWFREEHKIIIEARPLNTLSWWDALVCNEKLERVFRDAGYPTYYEALNAGIEQALKLI